MVVLNLENVFACGFLFFQVAALEDPEVYLSVEKTYTLFFRFSYSFRKDCLSVIWELKVTVAEVSTNASGESYTTSETQARMKYRHSRVLYEIHTLSL